MTMGICQSALGAGIVCSVLVSSVCAADAPKIFERGGVRLFIDEKRIEMQGRFCLAEGPIELLACAKGGKEYESVISLDVNPEMLHLCLLMMGLKPGKTGPLHQGDPDHVPTGDPVTVKVKWNDGDRELLHRGEDLCWNVVDRRPMDRTPWVFAGSRIQEDPQTGKRVYWANVEKSLIVVYRDPFAVLDLPIALGANDEAFVVNKNLVPKVGTPCTVILEPGQFSAPEINPAGGRVFRIDVTGGGRVLVNDVQFADLKAALGVIARYAPLDSCRVSIDHGPTQVEFGSSTAAAAADTFEALNASGVPIESVTSTHLQPASKDAATIAVSGDDVIVAGRPLADKEAGIAVRGLVKRAGGGSITIEVREDAALTAVARALRACDGAEGGLVRIVWGRNKPAITETGRAVKRPGNQAGGGILSVEVRSTGDVVIDGAEVTDPEATLRIIGAYAPMDSCLLTIEHGAPLRATARVLSGLAAGKVDVEAIQMNRLEEDVADVLTVRVAGDGISVEGKPMGPRDVAKLAVERVAGKDKGGVAVHVGQGARLDVVAEILDVLSGTTEKAIARLLYDGR